jgi:opacity protein-like surface antigen
MKRFASTFAFLVLVISAARAQSAAPELNDAAPGGDIWRVMISPATLHYHYNEDHRRVYMLGVERQSPGGFVMGGSWFRNSFGQPSAYAYAGRRFNNFTSYDPLFAQVTGGLLYGYRAPFEDKVPFNHHGWSPGAVLSVGWQFTPMASAQLNFLGNAAVMLQFSADFR